MTYNVFSGTLNLTQSINQSIKQTVSLLDTEEVCARLTLCLIVVCRLCRYLTPRRCVLVWRCVWSWCAVDTEEVCARLTLCLIAVCRSCRYLTLRRCVLVWRCVWSWCADRVITWHWGVCSSDVSDRRWSRCVDCVVTWHRGGVCSSDVFDRGVQIVSLLDTEEVCARLMLCLIVICTLCLKKKGPPWNSL